VPLGVLSALADLVGDTCWALAITGESGVHGAAESAHWRTSVESSFAGESVFDTTVNVDANLLDPRFFGLLSV
jgi:hypothetical protein